MYYTKEETYIFRMPSEYKSFLRFTKDLKELGISYREDTASSVSHSVITREMCSFDLSTDGDILKISNKED